MTRTPMAASPAGGDPFGPLTRARCAHVETHGTRGLTHRGLSAELIADRWEFAREDLDATRTGSRPTRFDRIPSSEPRSHAAATSGVLKAWGLTDEETARMLRAGDCEKEAVAL